MKLTMPSTRLRTSPGLFLQVVSLLYSGVLITGVYYNAIIHVAWWRATVFIGLMLILLALEQWAQRSPKAHTNRFTKIGLLVARVILIEVVTTVDSSGLSRALYPLVPFAAYFSLGKRVSYWLALLYLVMFVGKLSLTIPSWYIEQGPLSELFMLFIGLVFAISMASVACEADEQRKRAEHLLGDLALSHQQLKAYAVRAAELAAVEERNRLARDIHDGIGHYLVAITVLLEKILAFRQRDPEEAEIAALDARRLAREALQDVRQSVGMLRLSGEVFSLSTALTSLVKSLDQQHCTISLKITGAESDFPKSALQALYRVAQEALTNVQKHTSASNVSLEVALDEENATLHVNDDGEGFDTTLLERLPAQRNTRFGLQGIRERMEIIGGVLTLESYPNAGTHLYASIPKRMPELEPVELMKGSDAAR